MSQHQAGKAIKRRRFAKSQQEADLERTLFGHTQGSSLDKLFESAPVKKSSNKNGTTSSSSNKREVKTTFTDITKGKIAASLLPSSHAEPAHYEDSDVDREDSELKSMKDGDLFTVDRQGVATKGGKEVREDQRKKQKLVGGKRKREESDGEEDGTVPGWAKPTPSKKSASNGAAWVDEDDTALRVDLTAKNRTKKLRKNEEEKTIRGDVYEKRLRRQFNDMKGSTSNNTGDDGSGSSWAEVPKSVKAKLGLNTKNEGKGYADDEEEDDTGVEAASRILSSTSNLTYDANKSASGLPILPSGFLDLARSADINKQAPSYSVISSVKFHPNSHIAMTAGLDKTIRLFNIDCDKNEKIQSVTLENMPIYCAEFLGAPTSQNGSSVYGNNMDSSNNNPTEIIATGRRKHFYVYDLEHGAVMRVPGIVGRSELSLEHFIVSPDQRILAFIGIDGYIILVSAKSKQWIGNLKASTRFSSIAFTPDSRYLLSVGHDSYIYYWDVNTRRLINRHMDEGSVHCTVVATSPCGRYYATGNDSGVVNLYTTNNLTSYFNSSSHSASNSVSGGNGIFGPRGGSTSVNFGPRSDNNDDNDADESDSSDSSDSSDDDDSDKEDMYSKPSRTKDKAKGNDDDTTHPKPSKSVMNLATQISQITFSNGGEIMAIASRNKQDQMKLVHTGTMTTFTNWPTQRTPLSYVQNISFSPNDGILAIANDKGKCLAYRINHYQSV